MIITPAITWLGLGAARIDWSGTAGAIVRLFVNGALTIGPTAIATANKSLTAYLTDPCIVEVHESAFGEHVPSAQVGLWRRPLVWFSTVAAAVEYRIWQGSQVLAAMLGMPSSLHVEHVLQQDVRQDAGVWTTLRIESVSALGQVSTQGAFPVHAPGAPTAPTAVTVTGGGGVFNLSVVT